MSLPYERHQMTPLEIAVWARAYYASWDNREEAHFQEHGESYDPSNPTPALDEAVYTQRAIDAADGEVQRLRDGFAREHDRLKLKEARARHQIRVQMVNGLFASISCSCGYKPRSSADSNLPQAAKDARDGYDVEELMTLHLSFMYTLAPSSNPLKLVPDCTTIHCSPEYPCVPCAIAKAQTT